jgi:hypothetical protein
MTKVSVGVLDLKQRTSDPTLFEWPAKPMKTALWRTFASRPWRLANGLLTWSAASEGSPTRLHLWLPEATEGRQALSLSNREGAGGVTPKRLLVKRLAVKGEGNVNRTRPRYEDCG